MGHAWLADVCSISTQYAAWGGGGVAWELYTYLCLCTNSSHDRSPLAAPLCCSAPRWCPLPPLRPPPMPATQTADRDACKTQCMHACCMHATPLPMRQLWRQLCADVTCRTTPGMPPTARWRWIERSGRRLSGGRRRSFWRSGRGLRHGRRALAASSSRVRRTTHRTSSTCAGAGNALTGGAHPPPGRSNCHHTVCACEKAGCAWHAGMHTAHPRKCPLKGGRLCPCWGAIRTRRVASY